MIPAERSAGSVRNYFVRCFAYDAMPIRIMARITSVRLTARWNGSEARISSAIVSSSRATSASSKRLNFTTSSVALIFRVARGMDGDELTVCVADSLGFASLITLVIVSNRICVNY